jgi:hypothetical protein
MFGKKGIQHPEAISVEGLDLLDNSVEVARLWVEDGGPATCIIQPERLAEPEMFGMLMVDAIRHGARAFSQCYGMTEEEALSRVWQGVDMERGDPSSPLDTVQNYEEGGLN